LPRFFFDGAASARDSPLGQYASLCATTKVNALMVAIDRRRAVAQQLRPVLLRGADWRKVFRLDEHDRLTELGGS
jgi:hypothetical protein